MRCKVAIITSTFAVVTMSAHPETRCSIFFSSKKDVEIYSYFFCTKVNFVPKVLVSSIFHVRSEAHTIKGKK